ncbi:MAG: hypothetical protein ACI3YT_10415 [Prevotella sp.]
MKNITLNILRSVVIDKVKVDAHIKGLYDKAVDERASKMAYQETAGDEAEHERKLFNSMISAAESLATQFTDYLDDCNQVTGDNAVIVCYDVDSEIIYKLRVTDRFNENYTSSLARLSSEYIAYSMLVEWYDTINPKQSEIYAKQMENKLNDIKRCFTKLPPKAPTYPFTQTLSVDKGSVEIVFPKNYFKTEHPFEELIKREVVINYTIDENCIDDIEFMGSVKGFCVLNKGMGLINIIPTGLGEGTITIWSRHMEAQTKKNIKLVIRYEEE